MPYIQIVSNCPVDHYFGKGQTTPLLMSPVTSLPRCATPTRDNYRNYANREICKCLKMTCTGSGSIKSIKRTLSCNKQRPLHHSLSLVLWFPRPQLTLHNLSATYRERKDKRYGHFVRVCMSSSVCTSTARVSVTFEEQILVTGER